MLLEPRSDPRLSSSLTVLIVSTGAQQMQPKPWLKGDAEKGKSFQFQQQKSVYLEATILMFF